ncbi:hypothetical protein [Polynucleobacter tropicus]|uniref:hypothetical protein n=1 Tax=Polynucleobacter tropicus TaxID=1743174 RepID=UPI001570EC9F|nr:hypothetical protein [Polynucleobacter tropicus]
MSKSSNQTPNRTLKWLIAFAILGLALFVLVDQGICNRWVYHDYAAGIDRRMECFWK